MDKWIHVSERLPKEGQFVIVLWAFDFVPDKFYVNTECYNPQSNMWHDGAKYWFPLPELPNREESK